MISCPWWWCFPSELQNSESLGTIPGQGSRHVLCNGAGSQLLCVQASRPIESLSGQCQEISSVWCSARARLIGVCSRGPEVLHLSSHRKSHQIFLFMSVFSCIHIPSESTYHYIELIQCNPAALCKCRANISTCIWQNSENSYFTFTNFASYRDEQNNEEQAKAVRQWAVCCFLGFFCSSFNSSFQECSYSPPA